MVNIGPLRPHSFTLTYIHICVQCPFEIERRCSSCTTPLQRRWNYTPYKWNKLLQTRIFHPLNERVVQKLYWNLYWFIMSIKKNSHWIAYLLFKAPVDFSAGLLGKCSFLAKKSTLHRPLIDPPDAQQQLPNPLNEGRRRLLFCCVSFAVNWFFDVPNKVKRDEYNLQDEPHQHIVIHPSQSMGNIMDR